MKRGRPFFNLHEPYVCLVEIMCIYKNTFIQYTYVYIYIYTNLGEHVHVVFVCVAQREREEGECGEGGGEKCVFVDGRDRVGLGRGESRSGSV